MLSTAEHALARRFERIRQRSDGTPAVPWRRGMIPPREPRLQHNSLATGDADRSRRLNANIPLGRPD